ncbi:MAG: ATP-dependent DNA helicase, partial [Acidimicrobiales bacterium]
ERQLAGVRFASVEDGNEVVERVIQLAIEQSVCLTPDTTRHAPARYRRADGTSRLRPEGHRLFTSQTLIDAESRLLDASRLTGAPGVSTATVATVCDSPVGVHQVTLSLDQALAVEKIATSGQMLDVLVGPAGTGKSVTMAGLRAAWEAEHGAGSVVGLAPSAAAAEVLSGELGLDAENTAKWLHEYRQLPAKRDELARLRTTTPHLSAGPQAQERIAALEAHIAKWTLRPGQVVIVDEASLAGTFALDELVSAAADAGAKVLLVGDWGQLSSVDAGGAFGLVARDRGETVPELTDIRRFQNPWEKRASIDLRMGHTHAIEEYQSHGRIVSGSRDELLDAVYQSWRADIAAGKTSLMLAGDTATVAELNSRARADRVAAGHVAEAGLDLSGGQVAGVGDEVVTRQNDRRLLTGRSWVKNGDRWTVTATHADGSMTVSRLGSHGAVVLPAQYVSDHVELAYASTAHRAQGRTVDTSHSMVGPTTTREVLYVSATRGRESNLLYVDTHFDPDPQTSHDGVVAPQTVEAVLTGVLRNEGADLSAHQTIVQEEFRAESIPALAAEYITLSREAQADRWDALLAQSITTPYELELVRGSDALGPLTASFRDAEARGVTVTAVVPQLVAQHSFAGADDIAAVLHARMKAYVIAAGVKRPPASNLVCGLFPRPQNITDPDTARALDERAEAMEARARMLATEALSKQAPWTQAFGVCPVGPQAQVWLASVATIAAYRERWDVHTRTPLGGEPKTIEWIGHRRRAGAALERAVAVAAQVDDGMVDVAVLTMQRGHGVEV